jgi:hypothetical protein
LVHEKTYEGWTGERAELNAMTSRQLLDWLEAKLVAHGVQKLVPDTKVLAEAYHRAHHIATVQRAIDEAVGALDQDEAIEVPTDLSEQIKKRLTDTDMAWDKALWQIIKSTAERP